MKIRGETGVELACAALRAAGIDCLFGLPGSSTAELWTAARRDPCLRAVCATSELTASFMANGYARASGRPAALLTIAGPGFTYALSGLAEALLDSVPLVHLLVAPSPDLPDGGPGLQAIAQTDIVRPLAKDVLLVADARDVYGAIVRAAECAVSGEPGPVVVEMRTEALVGTARGAEHVDVELRTPGTPDPKIVAVVTERLIAASRPLIFGGQGAASASDRVLRLAELLQAPVITSTSGRGILSEEHALSLVSDAPGAPIGPLNDLVSASDLVLMLGCKLSHNASRGSRLVISADRLVRVDASPEVLARREASVALEADVDSFLAAVEAAIAGRKPMSSWTASEIADHRQVLGTAHPSYLNPQLGGYSAANFVAALRKHLPKHALVATDSGLHQYIVRAHLQVVAPRTLLVPSDFQSMGYGIPAAIGGALATGGPAVVVTGDGGFNIVGLELLTAVREGVQLIVLVFVDRALGLIRLSQLARSGRSGALDVVVPDLALLATSLGVAYSRIGDGDKVEDVLEAAIAAGGVSLVEVPVQGLPGLGRVRARGLARSTIRKLAGSDPTRRGP